MTFLTSKGLDLVLKTNQPLGCAKIGDLDLTGVHVDEDIVSLDVSVDDALIMEVLDATSDLAGVVNDCLLVQRPPLKLEQRRQAP